MEIMINGRPATGGWTLFLFGLIFAAVGLGVSGFGIVLIVGSAGSKSGGMLTALFGLPFAGIGLYTMVQGVRRTLSKLAFHEATLTIQEPSYPLGGAAVAMLRLSPKKPMVLNTGRVELVTTEYAHYSAGTRSQTYTDEVHKWRGELILPRQLSEPLEQEIPFTIPREIPPTWHGKFNRFYTTCEVYLDIERWPDLVLRQEVTVTAEVVS